MTNLKSLRSFRIYGLAVFDIVGGIFGIICFMLILRHFFFPTLSTKSLLIVSILITIPIGILSHVIFRVNTRLNYLLGLSEQPSL